MYASINSIETLGLLDGPGIRIVIFFNACSLRCKYCHNPETWKMQEKNYSLDDLLKKIKRYKHYFKNNGGVTLSGGEPLLHHDFILELAKKLQEENIHVALDTSGVGLGNYQELLKYIDLILLDIKHTDKDIYKELTNQDIKYVENFIKELNQSNKDVWIRQVIIPDLTDTKNYIDSFINYIKKINNIKKVDFLPYHKMGIEKYKKLNIPYIYESLDNMSEDKVKELFNYFNNSK